MEDTREVNFKVMSRYLRQRNIAMGERDVANNERNIAIYERDIANNELNVAKSERDRAVAECGVAKGERDIAEKENKSSRYECEQLQHNVHTLKEYEKSREQFVATLSHDLRNPVGVIKMAVDILKEYDTHESFHSMVDLIDRNTDVAQELISHLLDANLVKSGNKIPIELVRCELLEILMKCRKSKSTKDQGRVELICEADNMSFWGVWDPFALSRAFNNLLDNALKYGADNKRVRIAIWQERDFVSISFQNFGKVISVADQANIFDSHFRVKYQKK